MENQKFTQQATKIVDLLNYQEDSVVSRTIVNKKAGTITFFAFDKGQKLSEHSAPFDALVQLLDGEGEVIIGGKSHLLKEGDFIIMPANIPHAVNAVNKFKMMLIMIKE